MMKYKKTKRASTYRLSHKIHTCVCVCVYRYETYTTPSVPVPLRGARLALQLCVQLSTQRDRTCQKINRDVKITACCHGYAGRLYQTDVFFIRRN